jgi:hypothetical protein
VLPQPRSDGSVGQRGQLHQRFKPDAVFIDVTGIGAGVVDRLKELGYRVIGVEFGGKPVKPGLPQPPRRDVEAAWPSGCRAGCIPDDNSADQRAARAHVQATTATADCKLEAKEDMKKRGVPRPTGPTRSRSPSPPPCRTPSCASVELQVNHTQDYDPYAIERGLGRTRSVRRLGRRCVIASSRTAPNTSSVCGSNSPGRRPRGAGLRLCKRFHGLRLLLEQSLEAWSVLLPTGLATVPACSGVRPRAAGDGVQLWFHSTELFKRYPLACLRAARPLVELAARAAPAWCTG